MIQTSELSVVFPDGSRLQFAPWQLAQGEASLLMGNSGSGKTTLLHLLAGLRRPSAGTIRIADTELWQLSPAKVDRFRGRCIGLIFQQPHLLPSLTVVQNLAAAQYFAGLPLNRKRIDEVLAELNLTHRAYAFPYQMSQGEQQRAAIARAMLNQPKVILADEPTASLDDTNCQAVANLLLAQAARYKATLVIATHDTRLKKLITHHYTL
ncbi:MAG: ATP-binding cassette domain-containing protein [Cytophagales bacterium]|nr:ATP-binding cassette domain-containing protein [Cytophagales bacterium]